MIRGPVLPQLRERLWGLVSPRLDSIESGLELVHRSLDCSDGELGLVDGLARDALGAPVLVLLAVDGDTLLSARTLAAGQFLHRVGDALARAVPEASFAPDAVGRVLVVGTDAAQRELTHVRSLPVQGLEVCSLEAFRVAGTERFAVRWLSAAAPYAGDVPAAPVGASPRFTPPPARAGLWAELERMVRCMDPAARMHGDRFAQRIVWDGRLLGQVRTVDASLVASAGGVARELRDQRDLRRFVDAMLRELLSHQQIDLGQGGGDAAPRPIDSPRRPGAAGRQDERASTATRHAAGPQRSRPESLRASLAAARLSPEEHSALGSPASVAGEQAGGSVAEDRS